MVFTPLVPPRLGTGNIQIWHIPLPVSPPETTPAVTELSAAERVRMARMRHARDIWNFVTTHVVLRRILARHLECLPSEVMFEHGPHGKPRLAAAHESEHLEFSISRTRGLAILALSHSIAVGVDVECIRADLDLTDVSRRALTPTERDLMNSLPEAEKRLFFYRLWTRKEAFLKGIGTGLGLEPDSIEVGTMNSPPAPLADPTQSAGDLRWHLRDLETGPHHRATLAFRLSPTEAEPTLVRLKFKP